MTFFNAKYFFFLFALLVGCAETPKKEITVKKVNEKPIKKVPKKIKNEQEISKEWDSLNSTNVKEFLTAYGQQNKETKVVITTKFGKIKLRLFNDTPLHRANFIFLTKIGYFNTTVFYRIAKDFVIQGGNSDDAYTIRQRNKYGNYLIPSEFKANRTHKFGALAAAKHYENNPDNLSTPFEFYMVQKKRGAHHLDNEHTVFGEVISGYETMEKMNKVATTSDEWPKSDIHMTVEILD